MRVEKPLFFCMEFNEKYYGKLMVENKRSSEIIIVVPDLGFGGAEVVSVNLANAFGRRGYLVDVIVMNVEEGYTPTFHDNVTLKVLGVTRLRKLFKPLVRCLRNAPPEAILANIWPMSVVVFLANKWSRSRARLVAVEHTDVSSTEFGWVKKTSMWLSMRLFYGRYDGVVAVSNGAAMALQKVLGSGKAHVHTIYNPIVDSFTRRRDDGEALFSNLKWLTGFHKRVLAVGQFKVAKDYPTLVRAFSKMRSEIDARLLILGAGDERPRIEALLRELAIADFVEMPGTTNNVARFYECADVLVLSSTREGFGNVLVEAMERGVPIVSTDCPSGPREVLANGQFGTLVPMSDPDALAEAVLRSLNSRHNHDALRARAQNFGVDKAADAYLDLLLPDWRGSRMP